MVKYKPKKKIKSDTNYPSNKGTALKHLPLITRALKTWCGYEQSSYTKPIRCSS